MLAGGIAPQSTVRLTGAVIVGSAAGLTVIVRDTEARVLVQASVAVHVSVTIPPQAPGVDVKVDDADVPEIRQFPLRPLLNDKVLGAGIEPQATVISPGAVIVGRAAGLTVMVRDTEAIVLEQASVAVHVSVTVPPQAGGVAEKVEALDVPEMRHPLIRPLL